MTFFFIVFSRGAELFFFSHTIGFLSPFGLQGRLLKEHAGSPQALLQPALQVQVCCDGVKGQRQGLTQALRSSERGGLGCKRMVWGCAGGRAGGAEDCSGKRGLVLLLLLPPFLLLPHLLLLLLLWLPLLLRNGAGVWGGGASGRGRLLPLLPLALVQAPPALKPPRAQRSQRLQVQLRDGQGELFQQVRVPLGRGSSRVWRGALGCPSAHCHLHEQLRLALFKGGVQECV